MLRRILTATFLCLTACALFAEDRAKYVFYFIGDGMGVNQVNGTQTYLAALEGRIGVKPLLFTTFPATALVTTYSATNGVTDSAAAGTALATGHKTKNAILGLTADEKKSVESIAVAAKRAGAAVGITTSVSIDHATPAAFYAHQAKRSESYKIGLDLLRSDFDFYGGGDFFSPTDRNDSTAPSLYSLAEKAEYTLVRGVKEYNQKKKKADKILLFQPKDKSRKNNFELPYAIDYKKENLTLTDITRSAIDFLSAREDDGFFLMVEGGLIDWACHGNDAATAFHEVVAFNDAVAVAYEFYLKHPDETLIVVTADHETGGIALGTGPYELHTELLGLQKMSAENYCFLIDKLIKERGETLTWDEMKENLSENWGFFDKIKLTEAQEERLKNAFQLLIDGKAKERRTLYSAMTDFAIAAREIMAAQARIGWQSSGHSNGYVPLFAIGEGAEHFHGQMDNTEVPVVIARAAGYKHFPTK